MIKKLDMAIALILRVALIAAMLVSGFCYGDFAKAAFFGVCYLIFLPVSKKIKE